MKLRLLAYSLTGILVLLCLGTAGASAVTSGGPTDYTIDFNYVRGSGLVTLGPGSFSYNSMGLSDTTVGPPVILPDYMVPASLTPDFVTNPGVLTDIIPVFPVTFTQTSPSDDLITLGPTGLVTGLTVDSTLPSGLFAGSTLQLNANGTWNLTVDYTSPGNDPGGTYSVSPVPEPSTFGVLAGALLVLGMAVRRRIVHP
jgi:hypothetical protein